MLYCQTCRNVIPLGGVMCPHHGFTVQLACQICGAVIERGLGACATCDAPKQELAPLPYLHLPPGTSAALQVPRIELPSAVPARYVSRKFGVEAEVVLNGQDAEILTKMGQVAALLQVLAQNMNNFQGVMDSTRRVIKACRNLAADIQEEVEVRRGPQNE